MCAILPHLAPAQVRGLDDAGEPLARIRCHRMPMLDALGRDDELRLGIEGDDVCITAGGDRALAMIDTGDRRRTGAQQS